MLTLTKRRNDQIKKKTIKVGPKMWVSSTKEGKRQKGKTPKERHKTQKWAKANKGLCKKSALTHVNK